MLSALHVRRAANLEPRHGPAFARLTDKLAVQQRNHVNGIVEPHSECISASPRDLPGRTLTGGEFDGYFFAERRLEVATKRHAQRGNFPNFTVPANAGMIDRGRVERPLLERDGRIFRPWELVSHHKGCD